jgi:hypothetical protein
MLNLPSRNPSPAGVISLKRGAFWYKMAGKSPCILHICTMYYMKHLLFALVFLSLRSSAQTNSYNQVLEKATEHRNNQLAAHDILWGYSHNNTSQNFVFDQKAGTMTVERGTNIIQYDIQVVGTFNSNDSTFLWSTENESINKNLTKAVRRLQNVSDKNGWNIFPGKAIKCNFNKAKELATLTFYVDSANGIERVNTNNNKTVVFYTFYEVRITNRMFKLFHTNIPVKPQYQIVKENSLIELCKKYITEFDASEKKYSYLYEKNNKENKYHDTMFLNRVRISDSYWDTTSMAYKYHRHNRSQPQANDMRNVTNLRVVTLGDEVEYVFYDEPQHWGANYVYSFEICYLNGQPKVKNEFSTYTF